MDSECHSSNEKQWEAATRATHISDFVPEGGKRHKYKP